jgi:hypothetical protein
LTRRDTLDERETIVAIAESYAAVRDSCLAKGGPGGEGDNYPRMAAAWREGTYDEFDWCLAKMGKLGDQYAYRKHSWKTLRAHVVMWWIQVDRVQRKSTERVMVGKGRKKKGMLVEKTYIDIVRHPDAREQKAQWGIDVVQLIWPRQRREPWLPGEVFETAIDNRMAA